MTPRSAHNNEGEGKLAGVRVLVAEDSLPITIVIETAIEMEGGVMIGPALTPEGACELARQQSPDMAVVDLNLGEHSALGLIEELSGAGVKVVVATGYDLDDKTRRALSGIPVLTKPYTAAQLIDLMTTRSRHRDVWPGTVVD